MPRRTMTRFLAFMECDIVPQVVSKLLNNSLPKFPAGQGKGKVFSPLLNEIKDGRLHAHAVQTILVAPQALYELWRDVEAAPLWMEFVISVQKKGDKLSHWVFGDPDDEAGKRLEYDTQIVADEPGKRIAWKSVTGDVDESGEVTFEPSPNGRGTLVTLRESMNIPGGSIGGALAGLIKRTPKQIVIEDLRHFKQLAESGEIPSVDGQPNGPRGFSGSLKAHMYGENNPTPSGTSGQA
jgi:uncharacterized membrane protein